MPSPAPVGMIFGVEESAPPAIYHPIGAACRPCGAEKTENRLPLTELNTATRASRSAGGNKTKNT